MHHTYDIAVIGGGLAGLSLAIQMARKQYAVILFEKEQYPFHRVCGEYVSMESWNFLEELGISLGEMNLPGLSTLQLTAPNGAAFQTKLPLGGFGISRNLLDYQLFCLAQKAGVRVLQGTKVNDLTANDERFLIHYTCRGKNETGTVEARLCAGAFGKRSNLDVKWKRSFVQSPGQRLSNYIAVKYHLKTDWPAHMIGLHNFKDGYGGVSRIEKGKYCFCYLTTAQNLKNSGNSIPRMEKEVLARNPVLQRLLAESDFDSGFPLAISQVSFQRKKLLENGVLMLGDAAGMITPLCGNGMSMALHGSKIAASQLGLFLENKVSRSEMEAGYERSWKAAFGARLQAGRVLQSCFGHPAATSLFVHFFRTFPALAQVVIKKTHGKPF